MALIGVLTHHWAKADKIEEAKKLLDGNGEAQSRAPGFGARHTFISLSDPTKISTLVTWESNEIYDAWRASPERAAAMAGAGELWSQPPESERFEMQD
jgi:heme-degrading monooxygenase HmoA